MTVFPPALSSGPVADQALFGQLRLIKLQADEKTGSDEADRKTVFCGLRPPSGLLYLFVFATCEPLHFLTVHWPVSGLGAWGTRMCTDIY